MIEYGNRIKQLGHRERAELVFRRIAGTQQERVLRRRRKERAVLRFHPVRCLEYPGCRDRALKRIAICLQMNIEIAGPVRRHQRHKARVRKKPPARCFDFLKQVPVLVKRA